ncbi:GNAT family N-acetyltransferase [Acetobacter lambici]|uniref:GNAT family N-acetyltransferase n=1 Tax=Acetobacter lambici TaxID=1332824 RepID=A0ABT1EY29_9PROT|nr:GNAT family N-acetyltransferase [Acetobacter lambici]MCP1241730.1 GNAT family N-acetyltransferase [Acetobacter lambici]MCP1257855.1 GNAT family N-acetyltransferase [Acetobacter lambici]NHO56563.1 GNAT family N-acetyltransferase [Acetobacter lambici]
MPFLFRTPTLADAQMLLDWRTSPDIAAQMTTQVPYDLEKQKAWLSACNAREDYVHFVIMLKEGKTPVGYLSYNKIDWQKRECEMGYYTVLEKHKRHLGAYIPQFASDYCFHVMKMEKIVSCILPGNKRMIESMRRRNIPMQEQPDGSFYFEQSVDDFLSRTRWFSLEQTLSAFPPGRPDPA